ncbi:hypothetical protein [Streptomyces sp. NPDC018610]|uniref:hypothetical protein n=1 Tax=Streptomyces sp. NPDC018610 TaxID=3365049 RepID=UPI0037AA91CB
MADIDPLIAVRPDRGAARISVYGEVQRQVLAQTLAAEYGIDADFGEAAVLCVERPWGPATVVLRMGQPGHLHNVTLGVRVEPAPPGSGVHLVVAAERSGLPLHVYSTIGGFRAAMLDYLAEPLASGPYGWPVTDLRIMVTKSAYAPAGPRAVDVRHTVADVVREAIGQAGPTVCEPVDRFTVEGPAHTLSAVLGLLVRHGAVPDAPPLRRPGRRGDRHDADRRDQHSACSPARCAARSGRAGVPPRPSRAGSAVVQERGSVMGVVGRRAVLFPAVGMVVICVCRYARWVPWPLRGPPAGSPELTVTMTLRTRCPILAGVLSVGSSPWADDR